MTKKEREMFLSSRCGQRHENKTTHSGNEPHKNISRLSSFDDAQQQCGVFFFFSSYCACVGGEASMIITQYIFNRYTKTIFIFLFQHKETMLM